MYCVSLLLSGIVRKLNVSDGLSTLEIGAAQLSLRSGSTKTRKKPKKSAPFSHEMPGILRICLRYKVNQLSWVIFISHQSQKSLKKFVELFQLCSFFFKIKKVDFFPLSLFGLLADSCQIKAGIPICGFLDWKLSKMTGNCKQWIVTLIYFVFRQCFKSVGRLRQD